MEQKKAELPKYRSALIAALMVRMSEAMRGLMERGGPFGRQIRGGTNAGECAEERFYNRDDRSSRDFRFIFGRRVPGEGAEGALRESFYELPAGGEVEAAFGAEARRPQADMTQVGRAELRLLGRDGVVFGAYGMVMPNLYFGPCDVFQLRFVTVFDREIDGATVTVSVPEGWQIAAKENFHWDDEPDFNGRTAVVRMRRLEACRHGVAAFNVLLPTELIGSNQALLSRHAFDMEDGEAQRLLIRSDRTCAAGTIRAELQYDGGSRVVELPVQLLEKADFEAYFDRMIRG